MRWTALLALQLQRQPDPAMAFRFIAILLCFYALLLLIGLTAIVIPCWFICKKAGFSPWLAFLNLVFPLGTVILLYVLAFADWKVIPAPQLQWIPPYPPPPQPPQI